LRQGRVCQIQPRAARLTGCHSHAMRLTVLFAVCSFVCGCGQQQQEQALVEAPPPAAQPAPAAEPVHLPKLSPPKLLEVQEAVKRVFKDAAVIDTNASPNFIAGDFNGDLSQDIAVVLRVAPGKLAEMNEEFPAWVLRDPLTASNPALRKLQVEENDLLLAVIHGHGTNDWRDPQATQTHLLKNAVGSGLEVLTGKDFVAANSKKKMPLVHGDLIGEVLQGTSGYLYFSGESYTWYDPKTFKGEPARPFVHGKRARG
jgi:hypothetical protein